MKIMGENTPCSPRMSSPLCFEDRLLKIKKLKDDIVNLSIETRLSMEMEMEGTSSLFSKVNSSLQSIVEKYQQLNKLYVKECSQRRKVFFLFSCK